MKDIVLFSNSQCQAHSVLPSDGHEKMVVIDRHHSCWCIMHEVLTYPAGRHRDPAASSLSSAWLHERSFGALRRGPLSAEPAICAQRPVRHRLGRCTKAKCWSLRRLSFIMWPK